MCFCIVQATIGLDRPSLPGAVCLVVKLGIDSKMRALAGGQLLCLATNQCEATRFAATVSRSGASNDSTEQACRKRWCWTSLQHLSVVIAVRVSILGCKRIAVHPTAPRLLLYTTKLPVRRLGAFVSLECPHRFPSSSIPKAYRQARLHARFWSGLPNG